MASEAVQPHESENILIQHTNHQPQRALPMLFRTLRDGSNTMAAARARFLRGTRT